MPIPVTCVCGRHVEAPDSLAGAQVTCKQCGTLFVVPTLEEAAAAAAAGGQAEVSAPVATQAAVAAPPKVCSACGVDVSRAKRAKDAQGNYFCETCWTAKTQAAKPAPARATVAAATTAASRQAPPASARPPASKARADEVIYYPCSVCETLCTVDEVYDAGGGESICKTCYEARQKSPADPIAAASAPADEVFCESCHRIYPAEELKLAPDGAVLCKKCLKARGRAA